MRRVGRGYCKRSKRRGLETCLGGEEERYVLFRICSIRLEHADVCSIWHTMDIYLWRAETAGRVCSKSSPPMQLYGRKTAAMERAMCYRLFVRFVQARSMDHWIALAGRTFTFCATLVPEAGKRGARKVNIECCVSSDHHFQQTSKFITPTSAASGSSKPCLCWLKNYLLSLRKGHLDKPDRTALHVTAQDRQERPSRLPCAHVKTNAPARQVREFGALGKHSSNLQSPRRQHSNNITTQHRRDASEVGDPTSFREISRASHSQYPHPEGTRATLPPPHCTVASTRPCALVCTTFLSEVRLTRCSG